MEFDMKLLQKAAFNYDVKKIGFVLMTNETIVDEIMDIDFELTISEDLLKSKFCHLCNRTYMNRSNLKRHIRTVSPIFIS